MCFLRLGKLPSLGFDLSQSPATLSTAPPRPPPGQEGLCPLRVPLSRSPFHPLKSPSYVWNPLSKSSEQPDKER